MRATTTRDTDSERSTAGGVGRETLMAIYVPIRRESLAKLRALAEFERRRPQDQAAVLIEHALQHDRTNEAPERGHSEGAAVSDAATPSAGENDAPPQNIAPRKL